jgi:putative hydrolases of HD superfamily
MTDTEKLLEFIKFSYAIREVNRKIVWLNGQNENDAEHQFQIALTAIYIIDSRGLKLDKYKCAAMGLVHDIVETYAGDISVFADKNKLAAKLKQEKQAQQKLRTDWPEMPAIHELIAEYEARQTPEAKFVYALDKLLPEINNYLNGGKAWKQQGITVEQVEEIKKGKVDIDPMIAAYHRDIMEFIKAKPDLFKS